MERRSFLKLGATSLGAAAMGGLLSWSPRTHAATITRTYYITDGFITQPDGTDVYFRGYSDSTSALNVPAAPIIAQEGDTLEITINNALGTDHSFVIEGVVDSGPIRAGESKVVRFTVNSAGTYLFHDTVNTPSNRVAGLHGALAVMPAGSSNELYSGSPTFTKQRFWLLNEVDPAWNDALRNGMAPPNAFVPRYFTINGLSMRPPGHPDYNNPDVNSFYDPDTALEGYIGDRTLIRILNAGMCSHSLHWHANHVEWLTKNGQIRSEIWLKDTLMLDNNLGSLDAIFPFDPPPDAHPPVSTGDFVMHLHDEMTQTAGGGLYQFGAGTKIKFK